MPGKRYSAGAIFLQVVPVFANVQKAIEDQTKDIDRALGDRMEKAGERAGDRAGKAMSDKMDEHAKKSADNYAGHFETGVKNMVKSAERELKRLDLSTATEGMLRDLEKAKAALKDLNGTDFNVDFNAKKVLAQIQEVKAAVEGITKGDHELNIDANLRKVIKDAEKIEEIFDAATRDRTVEVKVDMDTKPVERELSAFEKKFKATAEKAASHLSGAIGKEAKRVREDLVGLQNLRIGVDISAGKAKAELAELQADLRRMDGENVDVDVKVGILKAAAELEAFQKDLDRVDGRNIDVKADVDTKGARQKLRELVAGGDDAANTFRSFNGYLFAAVGLGPALIPILGALAGGLMAIGPAAAVAAGGLASVLIGFSGIGPALTALNNQQSQAAKVAEQNSDRMRSAYRGVRDARQALADAERSADRAAEDSARRVADARRQAAEQIESALKQEREAQEKYADSVKNVQQAEKDLQDARKQAAQDKQDLGFQIRQNQLNIDQGLIDEFNAKVNFDAVMADGSSTNLDKEQARIAYEQAKLRMEELRAEQKQLADEKIAQDKGISESQQKVTDAEDKYTKAVREQKDALNDLRQAQENVRKARAQAARDIKDALREQRRSAEDSARAVARAQQGVNDAMENYRDALTNVSTQQNAVNQAMANLGPAGQHFARFLFGLTGGFYKLRDSIQNAMLPAIEDAITGLLNSKSGAAVKDLLITMARSFGQFAQALSKSFQGPVWTQFFETLAKVAPTISQAYGNAFIKFAEAMASMLTTAAPYAVMFANGLSKMMTAFAGWAASKKGQDGIRSFMDWAAQQGPKVMDFLGHLAIGAADLAKALAPWGDVVLGALDGLLKIIDRMDPKLLGAIASGIVLMIVASQSAYAIMQLILGASALFSSTVGLWVVAIVALVAGIALLYKNNKGFHDWVNRAWPQIGKAVKESYEKYIKPALKSLWDAVDQLWNEALVPFFKFLGPIVLWVAKKLIPLLGLSFKINVAIIVFYIKAWIATAKTLASVVMWLWKYVIHPVFTAIAAVVKWAFEIISWYWSRVLWPVFSTIAKVVGAVLYVAFKVAFVLILALVKAAFVGIKWAWNHILSPVFGAIAAGAKWLWKRGIKPVWDAISGGFGVMWRGIKSVWDKHLKPFFDSVVPPVVDGLQGAFQTAVDGVQTIWESLKRIIGTPLKWVLDTAINGGLIDGFNAIAKWVGQKGFDHIAIPKWLQKYATGGVFQDPRSMAYATGGVLPGYTPGRDPHKFYSPTGGRLELSGGEAIMRPEFTAAVGRGFVDSMNSIARSGGVSAVRAALGGQAYARGGIWNPLPHADLLYALQHTYPGHDGIDLNVPNDYGKPFYAAAPGTISYVGWGKGYGDAIFESTKYGTLVYGHGSKVAVKAGQKVAGGQYIGNVGSTGHSTGPHLHFGFPGGTTQEAYNLLIGAADSGYGKADPKSGHKSIPKRIMSFLKNPLERVKHMVTDTWKGAAKAVTDSPVFDILKRTPLRMVKMVTDKAWDIMPGWAKTAAGWAGEGAHWVVGGVKHAGEAVGDAVAGGAHAVGDGIGAVGHALGFADGGILPYNGTMMYDNGGYLPPGLTSVVNLTGKPEPVFTADQFDGLGVGGQGGNIHYEPHFEGSDLTAEDVAADLNFEFRKLRRSGKYEGIGS